MVPHALLGLFSFFVFLVLGSGIIRGLSVLSIRIALFLLLSTAYIMPMHAVAQSVQVRIVRAEEMRPAMLGTTSVFRLIGGVVLQHDSAMMWCDSAYVNQQGNTFDAYGRVRIESKELKIKGSTLYYDGNTGEGKMLGLPVVLRDTAQEATLWSDELLFDTRANTAEYPVWGRIRSGLNEMESSQGHYDAKEKRATVWRAVTFRGENMVAYTDSLCYEQREEVARFWGPTRIYESNRMAYGLEGWYNQKREELEVRRDVVAVKGESYLFADYLYADRANEYFEARGRVALIDSTGFNRLYTQRLQYWHGMGMAIADSHPLLFVEDTTMHIRDTLVLRSDTIKVWREVRARVKVQHEGVGTMEVELASPSADVELASVRQTSMDDSLQQEALQRTFTAWDTVRFARFVGEVRAYRRDLQMVADTMYVSGEDSSVRVVRRPYPYLWSDSMQASAVRMVAYLGKRQLDSLLLFERAIVALQSSSGWYDQIGGTQLRGYFDSGALRSALVEGDAQMIYYMVDDGRVEGINRVECPSFRATFANNQPVEVTFFGNPTSSMLPMRDVVEDERQLYGFSWAASERPVGQSAVRPDWLVDYNYYQAAQRKVLRYRVVERNSLARQMSIPRHISSPRDFEETKVVEESEVGQRVEIMHALPE